MPNNGSDLPLAINIVGPMAFHKNDNDLEVWLADVGSQFKHEAGIATGLDSIRLYPKIDYSLSGPTPAVEWPNPYYPTMLNPDTGRNELSEIYAFTKIDRPAKYIHVTLPLPRAIVGLVPVWCQIKYDGVPEGNYKYRATGVRLLYEATNIPILTWRDAQGNPDVLTLPIDIAPEDEQVEVSINYHPYVHDTDPRHPEAKSDFEKIAEMIGVRNSAVEFPSLTVDAGPVHDCVTPIAMF